MHDKILKFDISGFPRRAGLGLALLGALVLLGWLLDSSVLKSVLPGTATMKANTALCFSFTGIALFLRLQSLEWHKWASLFTGLVLLIGVASLSEYAFDWQLGIDQLLFSDPLATGYPGRMSVFTALSFSILGFALIVLPRPAWRLSVQMAAAMAILIGTSSLMGTLWNLSLFEGGKIITSVALHTAIGLIVLGFALLQVTLQSAVQARSASPFKALELKVVFGFVGALALILLGSGLNYRTSNSYAESARMVSHTQEVRAELGEYFSDLAEAESAERAYLLTHDELLHRNYHQLLHSVNVQHDLLLGLISDNPLQLRNLAQLQTLIGQRIQILERVVAVFETRGLAAAQQEIKVSRSLASMELIHAKINEMDAIEIQLLKERESVSLQMRQSALLTLVISLLLSVIVLSVLFATIRREMRARAEIERYERTHREALMLYATSYSREKIIDGLLEMLASHHNCPLSAFYVYDDWQGKLVRESGHCLPAALPESYSMGEGLVGEAAQSGRPVYLDNLVQTQMMLDTGVGCVRPAALIAMPVYHRQEKLGVLVLASLVQMTDQELTFVGHLTDQLAIALNNLKQFNDLKYLSDQLRQRSEEISRNNLQLEESSRTKSEFLANMSHELRTPLNAIIGFSEALKDGLIGEVPEIQREYISDIYTSGEHLLSLINDILDLSKVESGKMTLELEPVALDGLLQNALSIVKQKASDQGLKLKLEFDSGLPMIIADQRKLKQIVYNLLSNAVKFTPSGGSVTLAARHVENMLEISVSDTGIGISAEDQKRLYHPFTQIDSSLSRKYQGTGLGLVMIKRITELHGGTTGVESTAGKGSRFWVKLPWREAIKTVSVKSRVEDAEKSQSVSVMEGLTALVIEDDPFNSRLILQCLANEGMEVICTRSGEEALDKLAQCTPDLIILDILLPGMDGWQVLERIKQLPLLAHVPVVVASVVANGQRGFALGASAVLQKPITQADLQAALSNINLHSDKVRRADDRPYHALVVDDEPASVELMSLALTHSGLRVTQAYSGADGIALARSEHPDVILLDLQMPEVSGFHVIDALRDDPLTAQIPVIVVTAKTLSATDRQNLIVHVEAILEKTEFRREILLTEVRRALQKGRKVS